MADLIWKNWSWEFPQPPFQHQRINMLWIVLDSFFRFQTAVQGFSGYHVSVLCESQANSRCKVHLLQRNGGLKRFYAKAPKNNNGWNKHYTYTVKHLEWQLPTCEQTRSGKPPKYQVVITLQPLHLGLKYHHTTTVISCFTQRQWHLQRSRRRGGYGVKLGTKVSWYQTQLVSIFSSRKWVVPVIWMVRWSSLFSWTISCNWGIWLAGFLHHVQKKSPFPHNLDLQNVQVFSLGASSRIELGDGHSCIDSLFNLAYIDFLYILSN